MAAQEEARNRLRLGFSFGGADTRNEIRSDAANVLILEDDEGMLVDRFIDPRPDGSITGKLQIKASTVKTLYARYTFASHISVELSASHMQADVGDIEVHALPEFFLDPVFMVTRVPAGTLTQIPIQLTALWEFRPAKRLNPYAGFGISYNIVGFEFSENLRELSANMATSFGGHSGLRTESQSCSFVDTGCRGVRLEVPETLRPLKGVAIEAPDSYGWQVVGGMDYAFLKHWALFVDLRITNYANEFRIGFDGGTSLGVSVPEGTGDHAELNQSREYGPTFVCSYIRIEDMRVCDPTVGLLDLNEDGTPDPGMYYVQGGSISYGGYWAQLGVRYSF